MQLVGYLWRVYTRVHGRGGDDHADASHATGLSPAAELRVRAACDVRKPWLHAPEEWHVCEARGGTTSSFEMEEPGEMRASSGATPRVRQHHLQAAMRSTRPSISEAERHSRGAAFSAFSIASGDQASAGQPKLGARVTHL